MIIERFRKILESGNFEELRDVYATDALLDANVPLWRFQRRGRDAIIEQYKEWYPPGPPRAISWQERPAEWGVVLECVELEGEGSDAIYSRTLHLLVLERDRIAEHVMYCTGRWDAETVARHRSEAPMVRW